MEKIRKGAKCIAEFSGEEVVIGVTTFRNRLIIATTKGVFSYPKPLRKRKVDTSC